MLHMGQGLTVTDFPPAANVLRAVSQAGGKHCTDVQLRPRETSVDRKKSRQQCSMAKGWEIYRAVGPPASPVPISLPGTDTRRDVSSPFGMYTSPTCSPLHMKKSWSKSIMIILVRRREEKKDGWKGDPNVTTKL